MQYGKVTFRAVESGVASTGSALKSDRMQLKRTCDESLPISIDVIEYESKLKLGRRRHVIDWHR